MSGPGLSCPEVEALAAELALGLASATERAEALVHLSQCQGCQRLVDELAAVADRLLLLAPEVEPTIGFEWRVLAATGAPERPAPARPRRSRLVLAAAAAAVVLALLGGLLAGLAIGGNQQEVRSALSVSANGRATCRAFAFGDDPSWLFVTMEAPREWTADYSVQVVRKDGRAAEPVGHFRLQNGQGTMGVAIGTPAERLVAIRVIDGSGQLRYEADFT